MNQDATAVALQRDIVRARYSLLTLLSDGKPRRAYRAKAEARGTLPDGAVTLALNRLLDDGLVRVLHDDWVAA